MQIFSHKTSSVLEKIFFKGFYHIWAWRPFWSMDGNYFSNLSFPCPREVPNEIRGRLDQRLQRRSHLKVWTFFPYKCIGKQNWPCRKKVNCQCRTIILAIFVDLRSPMICAKIQPQGFVCVEALRLSQPNVVMSSAVSLPYHTFTGQA